MFLGLGQKKFIVLGKEKKLRYDGGNHFFLHPRIFPWIREMRLTVLVDEKWIHHINCSRECFKKLLPKFVRSFRLPVPWPSPITATNYSPEAIVFLFFLFFPPFSWNFKFSIFSWIPSSLCYLTSSMFEIQLFS